MKDNLTPGNREWSRLRGDEEFISYSITFNGDMSVSDKENAMTWIAALDAVDIKDNGNTIEFTTHVMYTVPVGWTLTRLS